MQLPAHELPSYIAQALREGFTQKEIAASLGCSESYISQVVAAKPELAMAKERQDEIFGDIDAMYNTIELNALQELNRRMTIVKDPMQLVRIACAINAAKRRSAPAREALLGGGGNTQVVQISMPSTVVHNFQFNQHNQAVALQGENGTIERQLITASNTQLTELAARFNGLNKLQAADPSPIEEM